MSNQYPVPDGTKRKRGVSFGCGQAKCSACYEPIEPPVCADVKLQQTKAHLDTLPGVLALWWFMENVTEDDPNRSALWFYCRERVRRYQASSAHHSDKPWEAELKFDAAAFELLYNH